MWNDVLPIILLLLINLAVIFRRVGPLEVPAWTAFLGGAIILVFSQQNGYERSIEVVASQADVFIFLFSMFVIVSALELSGVLEAWSKYIVSRSRSSKDLLFLTHFVFGISASILINDTVAIIAPLLLISASRAFGTDAKPYVLAVSFGLTYGSALLPTGNPQNFILASAGGISPLTFLIYSFVPSIMALAISYFVVSKKYFKTHVEIDPLPFIPEVSKYEGLKIASKFALGAMILAIILSSAFDFPLHFLLLMISSTLLFFRNERDLILQKIDWSVLLFFAGLFIVIDFIVTGSPFGPILEQLFILEDSPEAFIRFTIILFIGSQIVSNVPMAIIVTHILPGTPLDQPIYWMTAALVTTFAGGFSVLGAASNVIVLETSEKRGIRITWREFSSIGALSSTISTLILLMLGLLFFFTP